MGLLAITAAKFGQALFIIFLLIRISGPSGFPGCFSAGIWTSILRNPTCQRDSTTIATRIGTKMGFDKDRDEDRDNDARVRRSGVSCSGISSALSIIVPIVVLIVVSLHLSLDHCPDRCRSLSHLSPSSLNCSMTCTTKRELRSAASPIPRNCSPNSQPARTATMRPN